MTATTTTQAGTRRANHDSGDFPAITPANPPPSGMVAVASSRAAQEVQAAMVIAKQFPRDETAAYHRIMQACKRKGLAESSVYAYPRGGQTVSGPSIRMAEVLARAWGNLDFGIVELEQRDGESAMMAYAWDLETNCRQVRVFTVKHERRVGRGETFRVDRLTDPRDIYEMTANQGARRLRACILGVIPGDVVEAAVSECEKTMAGGNSEPLLDRARRMVAAFAEFGVTQAMIEAKIGHKMDAISEAEMVTLKKIYLSLRDGAASREQFFDAVAAQQGATGDAPASRASALADRVTAPKQEPAATQAAQGADEAVRTPFDGPGDHAHEPSGEPTTIEKAAILYSEKHGVTLPAAQARLDEYAKSLFNADAAALTPEQAADVFMKVKSGEIAPKPATKKK